MTTPAPILPRLLGEAQAAVYLGISPRKLRDLPILQLIEVEPAPRGMAQLREDESKVGEGK